MGFYRDGRGPVDRPPAGSSSSTPPPGSAPGPARFPRQEVAFVGALILVHLAIVLWVAADPVAHGALYEHAGLRKGNTALEPWRLISSLFLHADVSHVLWNGLSLLVFAVPVMTALGQRRAALVYVAAGVGGGMAAVAFARHGAVIIGSSGAVSGLFGAWVVLTLHRARSAELPGRARIRAMGIALLVLPSLINPVTSTGQPISVSSHLGGAATGMILGALLSRGLLRRVLAAAPPEDDNGEGWSGPDGSRYLN